MAVRVYDGTVRLLKRGDDMTSVFDHAKRLKMWETIFTSGIENGIDFISDWIWFVDEIAHKNMDNVARLFMDILRICVFKETETTRPFIAYFMHHLKYLSYLGSRRQHTMFSIYRTGESSPTRFRVMVDRLCCAVLVIISAMRRDDLIDKLPMWWYDVLFRNIFFARHDEWFSFTRNRLNHVYDYASVSLPSYSLLLLPGVFQTYSNHVSSIDTQDAPWRIIHNEKVMKEARLYFTRTWRHGDAVHDDLNERCMEAMFKEECDPDLCDLPTHEQLRQIAFEKMQKRRKHDMQKDARKGRKRETAKQRKTTGVKTDVAIHEMIQMGFFTDITDTEFVFYPILNRDVHITALTSAVYVICHSISDGTRENTWAVFCLARLLLSRSKEWVDATPELHSVKKYVPIIMREVVLPFRTSLRDPEDGGLQDIPGTYYLFRFWKLVVRMEKMPDLLWRYYIQFPPKKLDMDLFFWGTCVSPMRVTYHNDAKSTLDKLSAPRGAYPAGKEVSHFIERSLSNALDDDMFVAKCMVVTFDFSLEQTNIEIEEKKYTEMIKGKRTQNKGTHDMTCLNSLNVCFAMMLLFKVYGIQGGGGGGAYKKKYFGSMQENCVFTNPPYFIFQESMWKIHVLIPRRNILHLRGFQWTLSCWSKCNILRRLPVYHVLTSRILYAHHENLHWTFCGIMSMITGHISSSTKSMCRYVPVDPDHMKIAWLVLSRIIELSNKDSQTIESVLQDAMCHGGTFLRIVMNVIASDTDRWFISARAAEMLFYILQKNRQLILNRMASLVGPALRVPVSLFLDDVARSLEKAFSVPSPRKATAYIRFCCGHDAKNMLRFMSALTATPYLAPVRDLLYVAGEFVHWDNASDNAVPLSSTRKKWQYKDMLSLGESGILESGYTQNGLCHPGGLGSREMSVDEYRDFIDPRTGGEKKTIFTEDLATYRANKDYAKATNVLLFLLELYSYYTPPTAVARSKKRPQPAANGGSTETTKRRRAASDASSRTFGEIENGGSTYTVQCENDALNMAMREEAETESASKEEGSECSFETRRSSVATRSTATRASRAVSLISADSHDVCTGKTFSFDCKNWGHEEVDLAFPVPTQTDSIDIVTDESVEEPPQQFEMEQWMNNMTDIRRLAAVHSRPEEDSTITKLDLSKQCPLFPFHDTSRLVPNPRAFAYCLDSKGIPLWEDQCVILPRLPVHHLPDDAVNDLDMCSCGPFTNMDPQLLSAILFHPVPFQPPRDVGDFTESELAWRYD